ncbi:protein phosphatase 2C domain-containing protein [Microlunatus speluncae]|uniref:protein phosphatase 2C domain-containing protein n=1 Tax=Microlunatus speluncae TaxID=2594267 RepID=UPI0012660A78|nr:protein phosphatase 2C domain-containing protein [Microlunatus speluncae]
MSPSESEAPLVEEPTVDGATAAPIAESPAATDTATDDQVAAEAVEAPVGSQTCPNTGCGAEVPGDASFCEVCGAELNPTSAPVADEAAGEELPITLSHSIRAEQPTEPTAPPARTCRDCGGVVGADDYCQTCGTKAPRERDHYTEQPAPWVAAVCDRGIRHHRNEDASAIAADAEPGSRAVLVVCDGVSTSPNSDVASLAAARAAREVLVAQRPAGMGTPESRAAALAQALQAAAVQANAAVLDESAALEAAAKAARPEGEADSTEAVNTPSCTFAAAVVEGDLIMVGNVGDSRAYLIPDPDSGVEPQLLTVDDSVAQLRIEAGVPREQAENGPQAHAITKWFGRDSPDVMPRTARATATGSGWVLVCSDGLWNYASDAAELQRLIAELAAAEQPVTEPLAVAEALVAWANEQGGKDNITVALARYAF